jgi:hypothetical protein
VRRARRALAVQAARAECGLGVERRAEFDLLRAGLARGGDLIAFGVDEDAGEESALAQFVDCAAHRVEVRAHVESALGRDLVRAFGDERDGVGPRVQSDL